MVNTQDWNTALGS